MLTDDCSLPSGKLTITMENHHFNGKIIMFDGKVPILMSKSTISMAISHSFSHFHHMLRPQASSSSSLSNLPAWVEERRFLWPTVVLSLEGIAKIDVQDFGRILDDMTLDLKILGWQKDLHQGTALQSQFST